VSKISDISGFTFTSRSRGSEVAVPSNNWTGSIYDLQVGLSDIAGGSTFWITSECLQMAGFSSPLSSETLTLWVGKPVGSSDTGGLLNNAQQILRPFTWELPLCLCAAITLTSCLHVWFEYRTGPSKWYLMIREEVWNHPPKEFDEKYTDDDNGGGGGGGSQGSWRRRLYQGYIIWRAVLDSQLNNTTAMMFAGEADVSRYNRLSTKILVWFSLCVLGLRCVLR
jgi:hypothetical protein